MNTDAQEKCIRKLNKSRGVYFTLALRDDNGRWTAEFGDYVRTIVQQELWDRTEHDYLKKNARIVESGDTQEAINTAIDELNR